MNSELLSRPRVERVLTGVVEHTPLTLLHAPLGAGKTSAAATAFAQTPGAVWLDARPWHREAFIRDVVEAVRTERPDFGRLTIGAMESGASPTHLGTTFAQELTHIDAPLLLILDNVQVFTGERGFASFVDSVVSALPPKVHVLAMGRSLPDVTLGRSFARGKAQVVDGSVLDFDAAEIAALGSRLGRTLDDRTIEEIARSTEGWAAGVLLAVTAPGTTVPSASGPRAAAEAYLTKELLSRLDRDAIAFLEDVSILETIDLKVLQRSDLFADAEKRITSLRRSGAPLTEIAAGRYKLHPVLRELAHHRLEKYARESAVHRQAAQAYARFGDIPAAMFHADESRDSETAAAFLRNYAAAAIATGDRSRVRSLLARVAPKGDHGGVRLYVDALLEKTRGSANTRAAFSRAADAAENVRDDAIAFQARAQVIEHDIGHLIAVEAGAQRELSERAEALGESAIASCLVLDGWSRAVAHDFLGALSAVEPLKDSTDATVRSNSDILSAYVQTALGEVDAAQDTLDALIRILETDKDRVVPQTLTLIWFARLALVWGRITAAADAAAQAERLASALDLRAEEAALYVALAEIATHSGDIEATVRYAERARGRSEQAWYAGDVGRVRAFAEIALARAAFLGHDNEIARELAQRAAANAAFPDVQRALALTEAAFYTLFCEPGASTAAIAVARQALTSSVPVDAADAVTLATADDLIAFLDAANGTAHGSLLSGAEPFAKLLQHRRGLVTLEHAGIAIGKARRGAAEGTIAFDTALDLLTRDGPRFEARLARAYASSFIKPRQAAQSTARDFDLTAREHEILTLLVDGLTNKEIAQRLILSPRTIETHVERVLGKLQVGSRSRAIAMSIRLGLVSLEPR